MPAKERTSYCIVCDRVVPWTTSRFWQKHLESADHRENVVAPKALPPERVRPADLDDTAFGLAAGESAVFRRPDGLWIGVAAIAGGATVRLETSQRQIAVERLRRLLPGDAPVTKYLCLRCRLLLDPLLFGHHYTSKLHRSSAEPKDEPRPLAGDTLIAAAPMPSIPGTGHDLQLTMEPISLAVADAARVLGLSKSTISQLARTKAIPSFRVGSRILVPVKALQEWVDGRLREDAERYSPAWQRVSEYARRDVTSPQRRRERGGWRS